MQSFMYKFTYFYVQTALPENGYPPPPLVRLYRKKPQEYRPLIKNSAQVLKMGLQNLEFFFERCLSLLEIHGIFLSRPPNLNVIILN
jgi:hypothetical protein